MDAHCVMGCVRVRVIVRIARITRRHVVTKFGVTVGVMRRSTHDEEQMDKSKKGKYESEESHVQGIRYNAAVVP